MSDDTALTYEELSVIEARVEEATPGPWRCGGGLVTGRDLAWEPLRSIYRGRADQEIADERFIAHSREDVPRLVAEVRRLRDELHRILIDASIFGWDTDIIRDARALLAERGEEAGW